MTVDDQEKKKKMMIIKIIVRPKRRRRKEDDDEEDNGDIEFLLLLLLFNYYFYLVLQLLLCPMREIYVVLLGKAQQPLSSATHSNQCVQYVPVSKQWYGCQCLGFLTRAQMLIQAIAHWGRTDTVRQSALEADSGRKILCSTGDSKMCVQMLMHAIAQTS